jgi:phosphoribosyl 1,2-cyclic phosphodiesterase
MKERAGDHPHRFEQDYLATLVDFIKGADLVFYDTNFTEEEIAGKRHWGHSTPQEALRVLGHLDVPPGLVLTHHDPSHDDLCMDGIYAAVGREGAGRGIDVFIAKEGGSFKL